MLKVVPIFLIAREGVESATGRGVGDEGFCWKVRDDLDLQLGWEDAGVYLDFCPTKLTIGGVARASSVADWQEVVSEAMLKPTGHLGQVCGPLLLF